MSAKVSDVITQDLWIHLAALLAVGIGLVSWYMSGMNHDPSSVNLMFMIGGLAAMGVKIVNGSATVLAAATAAKVTEVAAAKAAQVVAEAAKTAAAIPPPAPPA